MKNKTAGQSGRSFRFIVTVAVGTAFAAIGLIALLVNIVERKQEGRNPFYRVVELTDTTENIELWGRNFPLQ